MSRRDLAIENAEIVKYIAEVTAHKNPGAKYVVISNPVDAMAMICKKYSRANFVISTGTNLESLRFRAKIAQTLKVPASRVKGWVGGEHGDAAVPLWSTVKINNLGIDEYGETEGVLLPKEEIEAYVKSVSKLIVDNIGGTEYGPAASFRDIVQAIAKDMKEILSIAIPVKFEDVPEPTFVGIPTHLGNSIGSSLYENLLEKEKHGIKEAAKAIYQTYKLAIEKLEQD